MKKKRPRKAKRIAEREKKRAAKPESNRSLNREAGGVLLLALCILNFLSIFSFNPEDITLLLRTPLHPMHNLAGPLGTCFAFFGFFLFGVCGYIFPFVLLAGSLLMMRRSYERIWPVWCWLLAGLASLAGLADFQENAWHRLIGFLKIDSPGGLLGHLLAKHTLSFFVGSTGTVITLSSVIIIVFLRLTRMHPMTPFYLLGKHLDALWVRRKNATQPASESVLSRGKRLVREKLIPHPPQGKTPNPVLKKPVPAFSFKKSEVPAVVRSETKTPTQTEKKPSEKSFKTPERDLHGYSLPPITILNDHPAPNSLIPVENTAKGAEIIQSTLDNFFVDAKVVHVESGPTVTSYEIAPAPGVRVESISNLERNFSLALHAQSIRIQAPIPGKGVVGIEVPNAKSTPVYIRELIENPDFHKPDNQLPLALGKDVCGHMVIGDLSSLPHLLVAGATNSGKTVCMNSMLAGLLMTRTPEQLRLILIDPKTCEFQHYEGIKHLIVPIITDAKKVHLSLRWAVKEMERRYALFKKLQVRDIKGFNARPVADQKTINGLSEKPEDQIPDSLPYIIIAVDELSELMNVARQDIEPWIVRLSALSRAAGIHMILATQRPSVDVITGTIKANIPGRIAFHVAQGNDSRTILDTTGAEKLLGKGDMLYLPPGKNKPVRIQGSWTTDEEIKRITDFVRSQGCPSFVNEIKQKIESDDPELPEMDERDDLYSAAMEVLRNTKRASTSSLQRRLKIGYNRAASLMDMLEEKGVIGPPTETGPRDILIDLDNSIDS